MDEISTLKAKITEQQKTIDELEYRLGEITEGILHNEFEWKFALTPIQSRLMSMLFKYPGKVVTKQSIWVTLYGSLPEVDQPKDPRLLDVHMCKLRKRLKKSDVAIEIENVWGRGWRMNEASCQKLWGLRGWGQ